MKKILLLILLFPAAFLSQENNYKAIYNATYKEIFKDVVKERYYKLLKNLDAKHRSKLKKQFRKRNETILELIKDSVFVFHKEYDTFLSNILEEINSENPTLKSKDYKFFFNRLATPNAACFGNEVFMINTGLFHFLENEDEFAFIVCHEIAHQVLNHVDNNIKKYVNTVNSKEVKRKIRDVQLTIYGRNKEGMKLVKNLTFNFLAYSRKLELEADSIGLELYKKTKYNANAAITALEKLKGSDEALFDTKIKLDSLLHFNKYPFKEYWLDKEESMFKIDEKQDDYAWNKDSLKTHPDIEERIAVFKSKILGAVSKENTSFKEIKEFAKYQQINSLLDFNQVDIAVYFLLKEIQSKKAKPQTFVQLSSAIRKLYELKLKHQFGKYVPQNNPFTKEENINNIRQFLHNLELKEIRKIGYFYCEKYAELLNDNQEFINNKTFFKTLNNK
ncbi:MAG: M48 family metallopeptidase [Polaribacter sp.]|uniref:M48 family metallopeptidase n=1 Tax=Polaribacter sp. TaxID=1920175 RepID=UPI002F35D0D4